MRKPVATGKVIADKQRQMKIPAIPSTKTGLFREGIGIALSDEENWINSGILGLAGVWRGSGPTMEDGKDYWIMADTTKAYETATEVLDKANQQYLKSVAQFRGEIKNDVSAIAASRDKISAEMAKIVKQCTEALALMNSSDMEKAIANAERLATALRSMSEVASHRITFAIMDNHPNKE